MAAWALEGALSDTLWLLLANELKATGSLCLFLSHQSYTSCAWPIWRRWVPFGFKQGLLLVCLQKTNHKPEFGFYDEINYGLAHSSAAAARPKKQNGEIASPGSCLLAQSYSLALHATGTLCVKLCFLLLKLQSSDSLDCLERLIDLNNGEGQIFTIDGPLCLKNVQSMFGWVHLWSALLCKCYPSTQSLAWHGVGLFPSLPT